MVSLTMLRKMRWAAAALPLFVQALLTPTLPGQSTDTSQTAAEVAKAAAEEFAQGKYAAFYARFDPQLQSVLTEEMVSDQLSKQLLAGTGRFERVEREPSCVAAKDQQVCAVPMLFEKMRVQLRVVVDRERRVAGLFMMKREGRR